MNKLILFSTCLILMTACGKMNGASSSEDASQSATLASVMNQAVNRLDQPLYRYAVVPVGNHQTASAKPVLVNTISTMARLAQDPVFSRQSLIANAYVSSTTGLQTAFVGSIALAYDGSAIKEAVHPIYNCMDAHRGFILNFTSVDVRCENGTGGSVLGFLADRKSIKSSIPYYRCINPSNGDHMDSISPDVECNLAVNGFKVEGVLGYAH